MSVGLAAKSSAVLAVVFRGSVMVYRLAVSPFFAPCCRFLPSCSDYAQQALREHRLGHALKLILRRLSRCHPLGSSGIDEVPPILSCRCGSHGTTRALFPKDSTDPRSCPPSV